MRKYVKHIKAIVMNEFTKGFIIQLIAIVFRDVFMN